MAAPFKKKSISFLSEELKIQRERRCYVSTDSWSLTRGSLLRFQASPELISVYRRRFKASSEWSITYNEVTGQRYNNQIDNVWARRIFALWWLSSEQRMRSGAESLPLRCVCLICSCGFLKYRRTTAERGSMWWCLLCNWVVVDTLFVSTARVRGTAYLALSSPSY